MATFTIENTAAASAEVVFDVLTDHRGYSEISPVRRVVLEREGDPAPNGVGAIRALHAVGPAVREEVTIYERPGRFAYKALSGMPVRDHVGDVQLHDLGGTTRIVYRIDTTPTLPVGGAVVVAVLRRAITQLIKGVISEAERGSAASRAAA